MSNEELKEKIVSIVRGAMIEADELPFIETTDNIADALIAAGIGDVSELQKECDSKEEAYNKCYFDFKHWKNKAKEFEHRAEVVEKALNSACFILVKNYCTDGKEDWAKRGAECATFYKEQAERELAKKRNEREN